MDSHSSPSLVLLRTKSHSLIYHSGRRRSVDNDSQTKVAYAASPEVRARPLIFATCAYADAVTFNSLYCRPLSIQVDILLSVFAVRPQPAAELLLTFSVFCIANVNLTLLTLSVYTCLQRGKTHKMKLILFQSSLLIDSRHVLHQLLLSLSSASQNYCLRHHRTHQFRLPDLTGRLMDCNFLIRSLFKAVY